MRDLDDKDAARQAERDSSIVPEDTHKNYAMVNDRQGGFRKAESIDEVLVYGDDRISHVRRKINPNSFETTTIVTWAPTSILEEIPDYYPIIQDGYAVGFRSRWVVKGQAEFQRWMDETVGFVRDDVLTGGHDAIHCVVVNLDESRPHIHIVADTFAPDPKAKEAGQLRVEASQMWGSHRDVVEVRFDEKLGKERPYQITGATKMRRYQSGYRERLIEAGFDIEKDVNPEGTSLDKGAFAELEERRHGVATRESRLSARESALATREANLEGRDKRLGEIETEQRKARKKIDADLAVFPRMKMDAEKKAKQIIADADVEADARLTQAEEVAAKARAKGRAEGFAEGHAEALAAWEQDDKPALEDQARRAAQLAQVSALRQWRDDQEKLALDKIAADMNRQLKALADRERRLADREEGVEVASISLDTREAHLQAQRQEVVALYDSLKDKMVMIDEIIQALPGEVDKITKDAQAGVRRAAREWVEKDAVHRFQRAVGAVGLDSQTAAVFDRIRQERQGAQRPQRRPQGPERGR